MDWPSITLVTPSFNQAEFLEYTIQSVLNQNYPQLEYIIIDGGSTDGSVDIIRRYASRLSYWVSERDGGHYEAVKKGISLGSGEIVGWINSDDALCPWALRMVGEMFASLRDFKWLTTIQPLSLNARGCAHRCEAAAGFCKESFLDGFHIPFDSWAYGCVQQESTFWRRTLWDEVGGLDLSYKLAGDFNLWTRFIRHGDPLLVRVPLGCFRLQPQQRSRNAQLYVEEARRSLRELRSLEEWQPRHNVGESVRRVVKRVPFARRMIHGRYVANIVTSDDPFSDQPDWCVAQRRF